MCRSLCFGCSARGFRCYFLGGSPPFCLARGYCVESKNSKTHYPAPCWLGTGLMLLPSARDAAPTDLTCPASALPSTLDPLAIPGHTPPVSAIWFDLNLI